MTAQKVGWGQVPATTNLNLTMRAALRVGHSQNQGHILEGKCLLIQSSEHAFMQHKWWSYQDPGMN